MEQACQDMAQVRESFDVGALHDGKGEAETLELREVKNQDHAVATMPASIRGLTEMERNVMEKIMVRKMDLVIL